MAEILACAIVRAKKVAISKSREIVRVVYLDQITIIGSGRARKLENERSREGRNISAGNCAREKGCHVRITRNCTDSIFRPNNNYWK